MFNLAGKKALVTGASGGIGSAIAHDLYQQGAEITLSGTNEAKLHQVKESLMAANANGAPIHTITANLSNGEGARKLGMDAEASMNGVDILVNNAGSTRDNLALRMKTEEWDEVINLDLSSVFHLTQSLLKGMVKRRYGRIINISSVVGVTGNPGQMNYCAAKAGIIGLSKSLAQEVASRNITVNCIAPGFIATHMTDALSDEQKEALKTRIPQGRIGEAKDISAACLYLASDEAAYMTGQTLHINGGMAMI